MAWWLAPDAWAQLPTLQGGIGGVYHDANESSFNPQSGDQQFSGDVVLIGAGTLVAADEVALDNKARRFRARGNIIVMTRQQVFNGSEIEYAIDTGDFQITDAVMVTGDEQEVKEIAGEILGFTPAEAEFEIARRAQLDSINTRKLRMRQQARDSYHKQGAITDALVERYTLALEQEHLMKSQENPVLARLDEDRRKRFKARRKYWNATQKGRAGPVIARNYYFRIEGEYIERTNDNDFYTRDSFWTPCKCEEDEEPAWGFKTDEATAQIGGYANLYHPVLTIKGIPVLYLPYLKIPIKSERQSGFLLPTFGFDDKSGNIISQPVYFALSEGSDATLYTDVFENRGTRLGVEYRFQQREHSGWELLVEGMRDRLWMRDRGIRSDLNTLYTRGLDDTQKDYEDRGVGAFTESIEAQYDPELGARERTAAILSDPDYWDLINGGAGQDFDAEEIAAQRGIVSRNLAVPGNSWRSAYKWQGVTFFAPRLSVVSKGEVQSDHRYADELNILDNYTPSYAGNQRANAYSAARARVHLDAKDFYAGLGTSYGDHQLTQSQYEGQQIPSHLRIRTKYYSLFPEGFVIPFYVGARIDNVQISEQSPEDVEAGFTQDTTLGDGQWQRFKLDSISPIVTDQVVQVSHFTELEGRYIEHSGLPDPRSEMRSWRTGLSFLLPIDGMAPMPDWMQTEDELLSGPRTIHHFMDWELQFSVRPSVVKRGPYANPGEGFANYAYYSGDTTRNNTSVDDGVENVDRMRPHRTVSLATRQWWSTYRDGWRKVRGETRPEREQIESKDAEAVEDTSEPAEKLPGQDLRERARRELMYSLDRPVTDPEEMFSDDGSQLFVDRYEKTKVDVKTPLTFDADISYDFLSAERREDQRAINRENQPLVDQLERQTTLKQQEIDDVNQEIAATQARIDTLQRQGVAEDDPAYRAEVVALDGQKVRRSSLNTEAKSLKTDLAKARKAIVELDEPLTGPRAYLKLAFADWRLGSSLRYNVYRNANETASFTLSPPSVFDTRFTFSYLLEKEFREDNFVLTRTQGLKMDSQAFEEWRLGFELSREIPDDKSKNTSHNRTFRGRYDVAYTSSSECWGLKFSRIKELQKDEREATYLLQLTVLFLGQPRGLPNMSQGLVRETRHEEG